MDGSVITWQTINVRPVQRARSFLRSVSLRVNGAGLVQLVESELIDGQLVGGPFVK